MRNIAMLAASIAAASFAVSGMLELETRALSMRQDVERKAPPKKRVVQLAPTPVWENEHVNTRQVRRQRERLAAKSRTDYPPTLYAPRNTSRHMPHIGAKERGRYAA